VRLIGRVRVSTTALVGAHPASSTARGSRHETTVDTPLPIIATPYWRSILDDHRERVADLVQLGSRVPLTSLWQDSGVPKRTLRRWLAA
jgi:hypothetical protein